jgi:transcription antitermination factor NusG
MLPGWIVVVSEPRAEAKSAISVAKLGYPIFYPKVVKRLRRNGSRSCYTIFPLYPRYFFAWVQDHWSGILHANGVAGVLMQGECIATVRAAAMKDLKASCNKNGIFLNPVQPKFQRGQQVKVLSGALAEKIGVFDGISGQHEAALFNLLGAQTRILFKEGVLAPV